MKTLWKSYEKLMPNLMVFFMAAEVVTRRSGLHLVSVRPRVSSAQTSRAWATSCLLRLRFESCLASDCCCPVFSAGLLIFGLGLRLCTPCVVVLPPLAS